MSTYISRRLLPQLRPERGTPIGVARERRDARALELDVAAPACEIHHFAQQDDAALAELRDEMAELVAGIRNRDRLRARAMRLPARISTPSGEASASGSSPSSVASPPLIFTSLGSATGLGARRA
jgi:hypothetical protein